MKKQLLTLALIGLLIPALPAQELMRANPGKKNSTRNYQPGLRLQSPQTRADDTFQFGYCQDFADGLGLGQPCMMEAAMEIPAELAESWKGNKLVSVEIGFGRSSNKNIMVYVTEDLQGTPIQMEEAKVTTQMGWNTITLKKPYEFDGTHVYIGYQSEVVVNNDFPIGVDLFVTDNPYSGWIGIDNSFFNYGESFGSVCIRLNIEGDNGIPQYSAGIAGVEVDAVIESGEEFPAYFMVTNNGKHDIESIEVNVKIGNTLIENPDTELYETGIPQNSSTAVKLEGLKYDGSGYKVPMEIIVAKVNGEPNESVAGSSTTLVSFVNESYEKFPVVEEFTGTWCGFCPRGIVGMAYMEETYGKDGFIGVGVHYNDIMQSETYVEVNNAYSQGGWPSAVIDRTYYFDPSMETLEEYYLFQKDIPAIAGVDVTAVYDEETKLINIKSNTVFGVDAPGSNFMMAYGLTENKVGPYQQSNSFSHNDEEYLEGWYDLGSKVSVVYNEVGRIILDPFGIEGSLPGNIEADEEYTYEIEMPTSTVKNINNCHLIAYIIDGESGAVINASMVSMAGSGVESLVADPTDGIYKVFNLQGVKVLETKDASAVNALAKGIYIVNGKKVVIR